MSDIDLKYYKKATTFDAIGNAIRIDVPLRPDHEFYTDFADVRGDFEDKVIYATLNVRSKSFDSKANYGNKVLLFLAGMRGSGKTSELAKMAKKLHNKDCFFCVTCNLDDGLNINDMEYMDILIFQMERLFEELKANNVTLDEGIIEALQGWFGARVEEVNHVIKKEGGFEINLEAKTPKLFDWLSFLSIIGKLKANVSGSKENADKVRTVFKNNFTDFANKFNEFIEYTNMMLRRQGIAQEILFIVDGLEKIATSDIRRKVILEETNYIRQIKANTIFTLPIELMSERQNLISFSTVVSFPFVKIKEKNGEIVEEAIARFEDFVYKRIDKSFFDSEETVRKAILFGGGSPRELLRILQYAYIWADEDKAIITIKDLDKAIKKLAAETSQYITQEDVNKLKVLKEANDADIDVLFDETWQDLLEKLIVLEYNDGTYKRVHPIVEASKLYQHYVG